MPEYRSFFTMHEALPSFNDLKLTTCFIGLNRMHNLHVLFATEKLLVFVCDSDRCS